MIKLIPAVLDHATLQAAQSALFAGCGAASHPTVASLGRLEDRIGERLLANPAFVRAALPKRIVGLALSRYEAGMGLGPHVDEPIVAGRRTDLCFTLFLTDPDGYERGELIVETGAGWESRKHAAGDLVLYRSRYIHSVAPVTRGTRLAATGWIESLTPSAERREILADLDAALAALDCARCSADARLRVQNARANLVRLWISGGE